MAAYKSRMKVKNPVQPNDNHFSSSEDDELDEHLIAKVISNYETSDEKTNSFDRTKSILEDLAQPGASICLICISSIKRVNPIWNCMACYTMFHLTCIQKWANDQIQCAENNCQVGDRQIMVWRTKIIEWCCPKCRNSFTKEQVPQKYICFCTNSRDPPNQPWLLPHSCGEICSKPLEPNCGHKCILLCHPGPCPPCPKTVTSKCHCGKSPPKTVRCSAKTWSCGQTCGKFLSCGLHKCEEECHEDECKPCLRKSKQTCLCGSEVQLRPCSDIHWQCKRACSKLLECGNHKCTEPCHKPGACGQCPLTGRQTCPCGKVITVATCPDPVTPCDNTCGKQLECGIHYCFHKCHNNECPPCKELVNRKCRCGSNVKEVPCCREYRCDTKCRRLRMCSKHACGKKCCDGDCAPCAKICGKKLKCGQHKCASMCHTGECYPCPIESKVSCPCGKTYVKVPCGRERKTKAPNCNEICRKPYPCGHTTENVHQCHQGLCPPCKGTCVKTLEACGHRCKAKCHEAVLIKFEAQKAATPCEIQTERREICKLECPPCIEKIPMKCLGGHCVSFQLCSEAKRRCCGAKCNRPLSCGNHRCEKYCHSFAAEETQDTPDKNCEECDRKCEKPRPSKCIHQCPLGGCHPGECPPCNKFVTHTCHCKTNRYKADCIEIQKLADDQIEGYYSCGLPCILIKPCGHGCPYLCHSGPCAPQSHCLKKVKVYCPCKTIKRERICAEVTTGNVKVTCDKECAEKLLTEQRNKKLEEEARKKAQAEKDLRELMEFEAKFGRRRKQKPIVRSVVPNKVRYSNTVLISVSVAILAIAAGSFYYVGF